LAVTGHEEQDYSARAAFAHKSDFAKARAPFIWFAVDMS